jgi:hypothetical protein
LKPWRKTTARREPVAGIDGDDDALILSDKRRVAAFRPAKKLAKRIRRLNRERDGVAKGARTVAARLADFAT